MRPRMGDKLSVGKFDESAFRNTTLLDAQYKCILFILFTIVMHESQGKSESSKFWHLSPLSCGERMRRPCSEDLRRSVLASLVATLGFPVRPHAAPVRVGNQRHGALMGIEGGQHSLEGLVARSPSAPTVWGLNIFPSLRSLHSPRSLSLARLGIQPTMTAEVVVTAVDYTNPGF